MRLTRVIAGLLTTGAVVSAAPVDESLRERAAVCAKPRLRRGWHTFTNDEKKAYLDAELCLMTKPQKLGLRGTRTLFDELQSVHIFQSEIAHGVGQFFPFHRLFMYAHEQQLQNECGYLGAQPYWNEALDAGNFSHAKILDSVYGFGGDGHGDLQCVADGPFSTYVNPLGPGYIISNHCIERQVSDMASMVAMQSNVDTCLATKTYIDVWKCVEGGPHGGGHGGINGEMMNPVSSPGDPLFYMHHTYLDRIWAKWQDMDLSVRLKDIGGNNKALPFNFSMPGMPGANGTMPPGFPMPGANGTFPPGFPFPGANGTFPPGFPGGNGTGFPGGGFPFPGNGSNPFGNPAAMQGLTRPADVPEPQVIGDPGSEVTLNHLLQMYGVVPNMTVAQVMDTRASLCYEYD